ncbi:MAG: FitA-like ribbon-helix-helix domain-containing protein [Thiohalorhabdus sp.]|uniref:FitA-like ribbon-helix-helix domain-containing protein n=1 Tax=Thiohalorhabdus sp. TaxID=3094134 RepID=UPI00397F5FFB
MANLTIRNLDDEVKDRLRIEAARHGRSMEEEVRHILRQAVTPAAREQGLGSRIMGRFRGVGGCELPSPERQESPRSPDFRE